MSFSGAGAGVDELFAATPSLGSVRVALTHAMKDTHKIMVKDVTCAFLYGEIRCISSCRTSIPGLGMVRWWETKECHVRNTRCATHLG